MDNLANSSLADIVTNLPHSVQVLEKYQLDYCCGGKQTLLQACEARGLTAEKVEKELLERNRLSSHAPHIVDFVRMETGDLIRHIVEHHHAYVRGSLRSIQTHTEKVAKVHGANHPELKEIAECFAGVAAEMEPHMMAEEQVLFPYIRNLEKAVTDGEEVMPPPFGSVRNPVAMMEAQHESAGGLMARIRFLSNNYSVPEDGCTTYRITMRELNEFEHDLHRHVHLENNILFPKAVSLEKEVNSTHTNKP